MFSYNVVNSSTQINENFASSFPPTGNRKRTIERNKSNTIHKNSYIATLG